MISYNRDGALIPAGLIVLGPIGSLVPHVIAFNHLYDPIRSHRWVADCGWGAGHAWAAAIALHQSLKRASAVLRQAPVAVELPTKRYELPAGLDMP